MKFFGSQLARRLLAGASLLVGLVGAGPTASAQSASGVEEIIVTARKREESAQDIPLSVTALAGEQLEAVSAGGADISFLSARTPSLNIESSFGRVFPRFYIRGLGNTDFDLNASQPVSLVYDDVVYENPVLKGYPVFDLARIEVLRGPQGTLFGRNTPAGVVKFESVLPTEAASGHVRAGARSFGGFDLEAAVGGAIAPSLSGRIAVLVQGQQDWVDNRFFNEKDALGGYTETAFRGQLRYQPNDKLDALINLHGREFEGTSQLFRANVIRPRAGGLVPGFDRDAVAYDGGAGNEQSLDTWGLTGRVVYDLGAATLTSVTGYENLQFFGRGDIDGGFGASFLPSGSGPGVIPFPSETADAVDGLDQFSQELRLSSNDGGPFSWLAGLYYFNEQVDISTYSFDTLAGGALNGVARQEQKTEAYAVFVSGAWTPTDRLTLAAGLRYSDDEKEFFGQRNSSPFGAPNITRRLSVGDSALSWDASATYALTEESNVYLRAARGFRAPSIQGRILFGDVVTTADSEFSTSIEAGFKSTLLDRRLRANLSAFAYEIEDQQLTAIGGAGNFNQLLNADKGKAWGFEGEFEARPTDRITLTAAVAYNNTEIDDAGLTTAPCAAPCTVTDRVVAGAAFIDGNSFPNAPEWTGSVTAQYTHPLGDHGRLFVFTDWAYKGETNFFLYESLEFREDGFWEGGLRLGYETAGERARFALYGRNITDEERLVGGIDFNNLTGFVNAPRVFGVEASYRY